MEARWNKIGKYPLVSYTNENGNVLNTEFFEASGQVFVSFSYPSQKLVDLCTLYCKTDIDKNNGAVKSIFINRHNMGEAQYVKFVIDAVLATHPFDEKTRKEIQTNINGFFAHNRAYRNRHNGIGLNDPIPMTLKLEARFDQIRELDKPWSRKMKG